MVGDDFWKPYDDRFLLDHRGESVVAHRVGWVAWDLFRPRSAIDIGCLHGYMLRGIHDASTFTCHIQGIDGPPMVEAMERLGLADIPIERISPYDLRGLGNLPDLVPWEESLPAWAGGPTGNGFDLVVCTETGEHLPEDLAGYLVKLVTLLGPRILWSAAHEGQGGTAHLNERPHAFWEGLFKSRGFRLNESTTEELLMRIGSVARAPWFRNLRVFEVA